MNGQIKSQRKYCMPSALLPRRQMNLFVLSMTGCPLSSSPEAEALWLDENGSIEELLTLLVPNRVDKMKAFAVSPLVNSPINHVPQVQNSL